MPKTTTPTTESLPVEPGQTARFAEVVRQAGQPEIYSLWQAPDKDRLFQKAVRESRIMTLVQESAGTKKDFGLVGFVQRKNVSYLVFPNSLQAFENKRIIGIKYDLLVQAHPVGPPVGLEKPPVPARKAPKPAKLPKLPKPAPIPRAKEPKVLKKYQLKYRVSATLDLDLQIEAENKKVAQNKATQALLAQKPDFSNVIPSIRLLKIHEI